MSEMSTYTYTLPAIDERGPCHVRFDAAADLPAEHLALAVSDALDAVGYPTDVELPEPVVTRPEAA